MDDETKKMAIAFAVANGPAILNGVRDLFRAANNLAVSVGMSNEEIDREWAEARADGKMRRAADLPDAIQ